VSPIERAIDILDDGVVLLTATGRVEWMSSRARQQLAAYFGGKGVTGDALPEPVMRWLLRHTGTEARPGAPPPPLVVAGDGRQLVVRFLSRGAEALLVLGERPVSVPPDALRPLGLSPRETEVLAWVAEGKKNEEIGMILGASNRTIDKHVQHILSKLGVEGRTAAAAVAFAMLAN
jgi:DNA-binding CsgD family transcriptional regulator